MQPSPFPSQRSGHCNAPTAPAAPGPDPGVLANPVSLFLLLVPGRKAQRGGQLGVPYPSCVILGLSYLWFLCLLKRGGFFF